MLYLSVSGVLSALINGIPMRIGGISNDGHNVIHIGKEPFALEAMWLQLKINEAQTEGIRLKDLPDEWFEIPDDAAKDNEIISAVAVFAENRAMDSLDFSRAKEIILQLENGEGYSVAGLYESFLLFDKTTIALMEKGDEVDISELSTRQNKAIRKAMAKFPSVIRTEYAVHLLKEKDAVKARECRENFRKAAAKYPMKSDIDSESEIMDAIDKCSALGGKL